MEYVLRRAVRQHEGEHGLFEHGTRGPERGFFYGEPFEGEQEVPEGIISLYYIGMMGDGACPVSTGL